MKVVIVGDIKPRLDQVSFPLGYTTNREHGSCETCTDVRCQNVVVVVSFQLFSKLFVFKLARAFLSNNCRTVLMDHCCYFWIQVTGPLLGFWILRFDVKDVDQYPLYCRCAAEDIHVVFVLSIKMAIPLIASTL